MSVIFVQRRTLPEAWERSVAEVWSKGIIVDTEYGERSKDATAVIMVEEPLSEPRVHLKGVIAGKLSGLFDYVDEVLKGTSDKLSEKYGYTYHGRLFEYDCNLVSMSIEERLEDYSSELDYNLKAKSMRVDQIEYVIKKLEKAPHSRRAQAITWQPWKDINSDHPPCLQRIWCRVIDGKLVMHVHIRSNDAFKAAFMNMFALTELQRCIAERLGVGMGYYLHIADSYHIYERDWKWAEKFAEQVKNGTSKKYWMTTEKFKELALHKYHSSTRAEASSTTMVP